MKKYLLIGIFLSGLFNLEANAQSTALARDIAEPVFTQFFNYKQFYNPAFAGVNGNTNASITYRRQWVQYQGAPQTFLLMGDTEYNNFGFGAIVTYQNATSFFGGDPNLGQPYTQDNIAARFGSSYKFDFDGTTLNLGLDLGFQNKTYDLAGTFQPSPIPMPDDTLPLPRASQMVFDAGIGAFLKGKRYYTGASIKHLPQGRFTELGEQFVPTVFVMAGFKTPDIANSGFELEPQAMLRAGRGEISYDFNLNVWIEQFYVGVSYRQNPIFVNDFSDAFSINLGGVIGDGTNMRFTLGYSYDFWREQSIRQLVPGNHELFLRVSLKAPKKDELTDIW